MWLEIGQLKPGWCRQPVERGHVCVGGEFSGAGVKVIAEVGKRGLSAQRVVRMAREALGEEVVEHLLHFARSEQEEYDKAVTDYERARYFERI